MSKHTPGPWSLDWEHSRQDVDLCSAAGMVSGRPAWFIALDGLLDRTDAEHVEEFEANARLIAAAPEMLEALRGVHEAMGKHHPGSDRSGYMDQDDDEYCAVLQAIDKAEGTS